MRTHAAGCRSIKTLCQNVENFNRKPVTVEKGNSFSIKKHLQNQSDGLYGADIKYSAPEECDDDNWQFLFFISSTRLESEIRNYNYSG